MNCTIHDAINVTNNIPDIGIHGCACYCHNLSKKRKKERKLFGKQNKTNEIKLDITAAAAALSIDRNPCHFFVIPIGVSWPQTIIFHMVFGMKKKAKQKPKIITTTTAHTKKKQQ